MRATLALNGLILQLLCRFYHIILTLAKWLWYQMYPVHFELRSSKLRGFKLRNYQYSSKLPKSSFELRSMWIFSWTEASKIFLFHVRQTWCLPQGLSSYGLAVYEKKKRPFVLESSDENVDIFHLFSAVIHSWSVIFSPSFNILFFLWAQFLLYCCFIPYRQGTY